MGRLWVRMGCGKALGKDGLWEVYMSLGRAITRYKCMESCTLCNVVVYPGF